MVTRAKEEGVDRALGTRSVSDLQALADATRWAGRSLHGRVFGNPCPDGFPHRIHWGTSQRFDWVSNGFRRAMIKGYCFDENILDGQPLKSAKLEAMFTVCRAYARTDQVDAAVSCWLPQAKMDVTGI